MRSWDGGISFSQARGYHEGSQNGYNEGYYGTVDGQNPA